MPPKHLKRTGIQLAEPFSESRLLNQGRYRTSWTPPYALQTKLDGERCRAHVNNNMCLLVSSTDQLITSCPHINNALKHLPSGEYDGELYKHNWTFSQIHSAVSTTSTIHPRAHEVEYHMFDIISDATQMDRIIYLYNKLEIPTKFSNIIKKVRLDIAKDLKDIMNLYDLYIDLGYEGFIIRELSSFYTRKRSQQMMKFKPKQHDSYPILEIIEATSEDGTPKGMVGAFKCYDDMGSIFKVGAGKLKHHQRIELWQKYLDGEIPKGTILKLEYQTLSDKNKVPHFSRAVEVL